MCDVLSQKTVKTRKPHRCFGCLRQVPVGTKIECVVSAEDGHLSSSYWCEWCKNEMTRNRDDGESCYMEGCFSDGLREAGLDQAQPVSQ